MTILCANDECTGCLACVSVGCDFLSAAYNMEGFLQPFVHEGCTQCGRCSKVCPNVSLEKTSNNYHPQYYACSAKDEQILMRSTSGGIFSVLAMQILKKDGVVYGAAFNDRMELKHIAVDKEDMLPQLCGAKYLQSDINGCYGQIRTYLNGGCPILFCGLPCQVEGLSHFLGRNYPGLLTVDLLCKGAPSPGVFFAFVAQLERKYGEKIANITFRDKSAGWGKAVMGVFFKNRDFIKAPLTMTTFGSAFSTNLIIRRSCYHCKYRGLNRTGDISLGDFWGINASSKLYKQRSKGVSFLSVNTAKGSEYFSEILPFINHESQDASNISAAVKKNSALRPGSYSNSMRTSFFKLFHFNPQMALT